MTTVRETTGERLQCDGCGRTDAGPGAGLAIQSYTVHDPNIGGVVTHHYCGGCAEMRGSQSTERLSFGWAASPVPVTGPAAADEDEPRARRKAGE